MGLCPLLLLAFCPLILGHCLLFFWDAAHCFPGGLSSVFLGSLPGACELVPCVHLGPQHSFFRSPAPCSFGPLPSALLGSCRQCFLASTLLPSGPLPSNFACPALLISRVLDATFQHHSGVFRGSITRLSGVPIASSTLPFFSLFLFFLRHPRVLCAICMCPSRVSDATFLRHSRILRVPFLSPLPIFHAASFLHPSRVFFHEFCTSFSHSFMRDFSVFHVSFTRLFTTFARRLRNDNAPGAEVLRAS
jgi:hypothetical protein